VPVRCAVEVRRQPVQHGGCDVVGKPAHGLLGVRADGSVAEADGAVEVEDQYGKHAQTIDQREQIVHDRV
jgi:hypothetical protein